MIELGPRVGRASWRTLSIKYCSSFFYCGPDQWALLLGPRRLREYFLVRNKSHEVLHPLSGFQYEAAFFDRLDTRRFILVMRLRGHELFIYVGGRQMPSVCSERLRRWIHFGGRGAAWVQTYGCETDMTFVRIEEESDEEFCLTHSLHRLRHFILDGNNSQDLVLPHVDLVCFGSRCDHFRVSFEFELRFQERISPSPFLCRGMCRGLSHPCPGSHPLLRSCKLP